MGDYYTEQLVKQKQTAATLIKRIGLIALAVIAFMSIFVTMFGVPIFMIVIAIDIFFLKRMSSVEYEYLYYNGDLDFDRIMGKESRKRILETTISDIDVVAPTGSIELQPYQRVKTYNFSSNSGNPTYELVTKHKGQLVKIIFEPNKEILEGMRMLAPRKVHM